MSDIRYCDMCKEMFPAGQPGSCRLKMIEAHGFKPVQETADMCAKCNPFLPLTLKALETRKGYEESLRAPSDVVPGTDY